ncbi:MAG: glycosyltransferase family 2 protein [Solirubrobacteraceae bacterium]
MYQSDQQIIDIVTVTYNSESDLGTFFRCVEAATVHSAANGVVVRMTVIDNASRDRSAELSSHYAETSRCEVTVIINDENGGIARANNQGIRSALGRDGCSDAVLVLNNDVSFESTFITALVKARSRWGSEAVIVPQIATMTDPKVIWYDGGGIERWRAFRVYHERWAEPFESRVQRERATEYAGTCALLVPREAWSRIGLMDERFFVYYDDVDFALRVRRAGMRIVITPTATLLHRGGNTSVRTSAWLRWGTFGRVLLIRKHEASPIMRALGYAYLATWIVAQVMVGRERIRDGATRLKAAVSALRIEMSSHLAGDDASGPLS